MNQSLPEPNLTDQLVSDLLLWMQQDIVVPGTKLPSEAQLIEQFGVSRTVVREAISQLKAQGIVRSYQGKGSYILALPQAITEDSPAPHLNKPKNLAEWLSFLEFRSAVESSAAALAARRRTQSQLDQIEEALGLIESSVSNPSESVEADYQFHKSIAVASNNSQFINYLTGLGLEMFAIPKSRLAPQNPVSFAVVYHEHLSIFQAIKDQDPVAAKTAMSTHLSNSANRLVENR